MEKTSSRWSGGGFRLRELTRCTGRRSHFGPLDAQVVQPLSCRHHAGQYQRPGVVTPCPQGWEQLTYTNETYQQISRGLVYSVICLDCFYPCKDWIWFMPSFSSSAAFLYCFFSCLLSRWHISLCHLELVWKNCIYPFITVTLRPVNSWGVSLKLTYRLALKSNVLRFILFTLSPCADINLVLTLILTSCTAVENAKLHLHQKGENIEKHSDSRHPKARGW